MFARYTSRILFKHYNSNHARENLKNVHFFSQQSGKMHNKFKWYRCKMSMWFKEQSVQVVKACTMQFEFIAAQRIRRSLQIFHLYTRIWDEIALKEFIRLWRRRAARNTKDLLFGAVGVTIFNWEQERITDKEIYSYSQEIKRIHALRNSTVVCSECQMRLVIDVQQVDVDYCKCKVKCVANKVQQNELEWIPFIERQDMLIWKREEKESGGLYSYKVYGSFNDVSAEDFLQVQIDIDYRRKWDATAKQLKIIDEDSVLKKTTNSNSDIIYWEMIWPRIFSNRDYVYQRRWLYDKDSGIIIIVSKGVDHPNAPIRSDTYRVKNYSSYMVIKPYNNFNEPGIEFGLTYFEDPGVNIPSAVTSWVTRTGLPDYLYRMRQAGKDYKSYKKLLETESKLLHTITISNQDEHVTNTDNKEETKIDNQDESVSNIISSETKEEDIKNNQLSPSLQEVTESKDNDEIDKEEENESDSTETEDQGLFDYFFLAKLFA